MAIKKKILVVDDEKETCNRIAHRLQKKGFIAETAYDGEEALKAIKAGRPDLVVLDIVMPKMNGLEVLKYLKTSPEYAFLPVIILSMKSSQEDLDKGISLQADFYLPKPFSFENLMQFINFAISGGDEAV
ncbi:MAG: response regulator [Candidatus Omnitrophica bacterium]|nr:response regulator [Candidatus Omnitrophota bacterium]